MGQLKAIKITLSQKYGKNKMKAPQDFIKTKARLTPLSQGINKLKKEKRG